MLLHLTSFSGTPARRGTRTRAGWHRERQGPIGAPQPERVWAEGHQEHLTLSRHGDANQGMGSQRRSRNNQGVSSQGDTFTVQQSTSGYQRQGTNQQKQALI